MVGGKGEERDKTVNYVLNGSNGAMLLTYLT